MASMDDLHWCTTEELFRDVDLDSLYMRQLELVAGANVAGYPYMILIHTGKITIGINLEARLGIPEWAGFPEPELGTEDDQIRRRASR